MTVMLATQGGESIEIGRVSADTGGQSPIANVGRMALVGNAAIRYKLDMLSSEPGIVQEMVDYAQEADDSSYWLTT